MTEKTVSLITLGCKMNQYESSGMEELFLNRAYRLAGPDEPADVTIINTCTVTGKTDLRSRQAIRRARARSPRGLVVVTGCYAQRFPEELAALPEVDLVIGNSEKTSIMDILDRVESHGQSAGIFVSDINTASKFQDFELTRFSSYTRAFVKVQDGCDGCCAYCAVTLARGPARSLVSARVIDQLNRLVAGGFREIVLTGINLGAYGQDLDPSLTLADLLVMIMEQTRLPRLRLSSVEPQEWTDDLIQVIATSPRICRHFHIPLQSGSDRTLQAMNRRYSRDEYAAVVRGLHRAMPGSGIGADVILGFPGEESADFQETVDLIECLPLTYLHAFGYSPREGTPASFWPETCSREEKKRRVATIRTLSNRKRQKFHRSFVGKDLEVLVISQRDKQTGHLIGLSDNYINVHFPGPDELKNTLQTIRITSSDARKAVGHLVTSSLAPSA